jgi:hypothetical protein
MSGLPLRYVHQEILVGHGDARAALFRLDTVSYPFLATADKREWLRRLARLAFSLEADVSLWRVNRGYPAEEYLAQADGMLDARHQDPVAWRSYLAAHEEHLRRLRSFVPEVYVAVSLRVGGSSSFGEGVIRGMDRARRRLESPFGVASVPPIAAGELEVLIAEEERAYRRAAACVPMRRATTREVQWLLRRAACRGLGEPALDPHWQPAALVVETADGRMAYEPLECDLVRHANAPVLEHDRALVVDAPGAGRFRRCSRWARCPRSRSSRARQSCCVGRWRRSGSRSTACCTRAGWATGRRSRASGGGSSTPTSPTRSSWSPRTGHCRSPRTRTGSSRASSTPTCKAMSGRRC